MKSQNIELIIFDCDGTLVDTEISNNLANVKLLEECGLQGYDAKRCIQEFMGTTMTHQKELLEERHGVKLPDDFIERFIFWAHEIRKGGMVPVDHAVESVELLSRTHKVCVGSNGERSLVVEAIQFAGLGNYFSDDRIFTKSQVARGKPAPDLFLFAAEQMGVDPSRCVVIEDSMAGIGAGLAAGMLTIGITTVNHDPEQIRKDMKKAGVVHILDSWPEITKLIQAL